MIKKKSPEDWTPFPMRYGMYRIEWQAFGCEFKEELVVGRRSPLVMMEIHNVLYLPKKK